MPPVSRSWLAALLLLLMAVALYLAWQRQAAEEPATETTDLAGLDANQDGIRDDVAAGVAQQWQEPEQRWALDAARAAQTYILGRNDPVTLNWAHWQMRTARQCLTKLGDANRAREIIDQILRLQLDTPEREQAYQAALEQRMQPQPASVIPIPPAPEGTCGAESHRLAVDPKPQSPQSPTVTEEALPPPNFFLAEPEKPVEAPAPPPTRSGWTTYAPRPKPPVSSSDSP